MSAERHNHVTREIRSPGECWSCDTYWAKSRGNELTWLRDQIWGTLEIANDRTPAEAIDFLTQIARAKNITGYSNE